MNINVRGLNLQAKSQFLFNWLEQQKIDVLYLQEKFCTVNRIISFDDNWDGAAYHTVSDSTHCRGVAILFHENLEVTVQNIHKSDDGRRIMIIIELENQTLCIVSAYATNNEQNRIAFYKKLFLIDQPI